MWCTGADTIQCFAAGGGSGEATAKPAGSDKAEKPGGGDAKKDNDYFKNLFSKGSNL
jgi:hypothetical protein